MTVTLIILNQFIDEYQNRVQLLNMALKANYYTNFRMHKPVPGSMIL